MSESNRAKIWPIVAFALAIAALIMVFSSLGKEEVLPFTQVSFDQPSLASSNEQGSVVVDDASRRLLFLLPTGELTHMTLADRGEYPISEVTTIAQKGSEVYVAGAKHANSSENIVSEAVLKFDIGGAYQGVVWRCEYEEDEIHPEPTISSIMPTDDGVVVVQLLDANSGIFATDVKLTRSGDDPNKPTEMRTMDDFLMDTLHRAYYLPGRDRCLFITLEGDVLLESEEGQQPSVLIPSSPTERYDFLATYESSAILYNSANGTLAFVGDLFSGKAPEALQEVVDCVTLSFSDDDSYTATRSDGTVEIVNTSMIDGYELTRVPLTLAGNLRATALLLSKVYLVILGIVFAVRWVRTSFGKGGRSSVRYAVQAIGIALLLVVLGGLHAYDTFNASFENREQNIKQMASYLGFKSVDSLGDVASRTAQRLEGTLQVDDAHVEGAIDDILELYRTTEGLMRSFYSNDHGVQCTIYMLSQDGSDVRYLISSGRDTVMGAKVLDDVTAGVVRNIVQRTNDSDLTGIQKAEQILTPTGVTSFFKSDSKHRMATFIVPLIAEDGSCRCALELSYSVDSFLEQRRSSLLLNLLTFAITAVAIYIVSEEVVKSGKAFIRYRELHMDGVPWAQTLLGRPVMFVASVASSMDAALAVVIAKDMLTAQGIDAGAFAWGVPALAITLGQTIGILLHGSIAARRSARAYVIPLTLVAIVGQIMSAVAIPAGGFWLFVAGKLLASLGYTVVLFVGRNLAGQTAGKDLGSEQLSLELSRSASNVAARGAAVVGGVAGGLFAGVNTSLMYVVSAVVGVATVALLFVALPKGRVISQHGDEANVRNMISFIVSPDIVATLVFGILPGVLASGYKSYIFPLFLDSAGLSKTHIANLFALGDAILYMGANPFITYRNARGRWFMSWVGRIGLGITFAIFAFNQSPTWAVAAIVVITVLNWLADDWKWVARGWAKDDYDFSFDQSQAFLSTEQAIVKNAQAPVLGALLALGASTCCLVMGAYLSVSGVLYWLATRHRQQ